jgi:hypothetical protein
MPKKKPADVSVAILETLRDILIVQLSKSGLGSKRYASSLEWTLCASTKWRVCLGSAT